MNCSLQIFLDDQWVDCARIEWRRDFCRWNYEVMYAVDYPDVPLSVALAVDTDMRSARTFPAFLYDLVPQGNGRRFLLGDLKIPDGPDADFPLICAGAFNPIGRIRVAEAAQYFESHVARHPAGHASPGLTINDIVLRSTEFNETMFLHGMLGAGTTGVQGAAPKYLLSQDRAGRLHGDAVLPDADATRHFIAKLPRGGAAVDRQLLRNEAAYIRVAAALGLRTHTDLPTLHGNVLLIPRFDRVVRDGKVLRLHQESIASILGVTGFDVRPSLFDVVAGIRKVVTDPIAETVEFIKRDILNLAMRNTDNHARNTAVQSVDRKIQLTPLFDFAPMYLDPELIPRALRWYRPDTRIELTEWFDVLSAMRLPEHEHAALSQALKNFAQKIERLPDVMQTQGVDHDIITFLIPHIDTQVRQLSAL